MWTLFFALATIAVLIGILGVLIAMLIELRAHHDDAIDSIDDIYWMLKYGEYNEVDAEEENTEEAVTTIPIRG